MPCTGQAGWSPNHPSSMKTPFIDLAYQTVMEHMEDDSFDVTAFCHYMAMSRTQLHRKIKAAKKMPTTGFIRYVRITEAKKMLREGNLSVSEIGYACGFRHISTFNRAFRDREEMAPTDYREMHNKGPEVEC
jgi:AraC-like DNA-binding protein